jgi:superfamily I DNA/RNA helicase
MAEVPVQAESALLWRKVFLEGIAGSGKTTYAVQHMRAWLAQGADPSRLLIIVPQQPMARPYQLALHESEYSGGAPMITTFAAFVREAVNVYWAAIAGALGADPSREPTFLNIEMAQYFMARFALPRIAEGAFAFSDMRMAPPRIISQVLDNLNRAALLGEPIESIAERLIKAWGNRDSSRREVFKRANALAAEFRAHCLQHNLLDFSLTVEAFQRLIRPRPDFQEFLQARFDFLLAENIDEDLPTTHDLLALCLPYVQGALLLYDPDGGLRTFLGADPETAYALRALCDDHLIMPNSQVMSQDVAAFAIAISRALSPRLESLPEPEGKVRAAISYIQARFYPKMIEQVADQIATLIQQGVAPRQIAVVAPYLNDSLRFSLNHALRQRESFYGIRIPILTHRPSRALLDEPITRALLTYTLIAHPNWLDGSALKAPLPKDVADAFALTIDGLDPLRAEQLTELTYRTKRDAQGILRPQLSPFAKLAPDWQARIGYRIGQRYDALREWLDSYRALSENAHGLPLDHFLRLLFDEKLAQKGYGLHNNFEAARIAAQLIDSIQHFRQTLYADHNSDWAALGREYLQMASQRLLPALHAQSWQDEQADAILFMPASTFLLRNRFVDYQFWLDIGSSGWFMRLEQPLTHPYVLRREYVPERPWEENDEKMAEDDRLYRVVIGLVRRCRKHIYAAVAELGESGFEQNGKLLSIIQRVLSLDAESETP